MPSHASPSSARFGAFELHPESGELRKHGILIKLHEQPLQVLLTLLEHAGQTVTRRELQDRLWPGETFVEFENSLNNAISRLREALGDSAENPRFIETVPRRGYRFLPDVSRTIRGSPAVSSLKLWLFVVLLTLGAALLLGAVFHFALPSSNAIQSLAVLPFRNLGTGDADDYFADGMTDAVTTELAQLGVSKVISETSVEQFRNTRQSVPDIARTLGVDAIVEGAVLRQGDRVRITVQLIRADTDHHVWAGSYQGQITAVLALQNEVALGVAHAIELKLSPPALGNPASPKRVNSDAYEAYLKGRYFLQRRDPDASLRARDYFQRAIRLDPAYAPAFAGLADYYVLADDLPPDQAFPKARQYAQEALRLDETLPDSHTSLAYVHFYFDWNWPAADQEFKRAIALGPGLVRAHRWYAMYLAAMGRSSEAMSEAQRAVRLDPLSISAHDAASMVAVSNGQYDFSIEEARKILELDRNDERAYEHLAVGYFLKGMYQDALRENEKALALSNRDPAFLCIAAFANGRLGRNQKAEQLVREMRAAARQRFVAPFFFASALMGMDKRREALDALEEGYRIHDAYMVGLKSTPWFEPLHSDPRFQDLLRRMDFPR